MVHTGTAGTHLAHLPEVVLRIAPLRSRYVLVSLQDVVVGKVAAPDGVGLLVAGNSVLGRALEVGRVQSGGVEAVDLGQQLPGEADGALLEVVAEGPVSEHFEEGVMVPTRLTRPQQNLHVLAHIIEVVVLATSADALLRVASTLQARQRARGVHLRMSAPFTPQPVPGKWACTGSYPHWRRVEWGHRGARRGRT